MVEVYHVHWVCADCGRGAESNGIDVLPDGWEENVYDKPLCEGCVEDHYYEDIEDERGPQ